MRSGRVTGVAPEPGIPSRTANGVKRKPREAVKREDPWEMADRMEGPAHEAAAQAVEAKMKAGWIPDATGRLFPAEAYRNATGAERHPEDPWSWGPVEFPGQLCSKSNSRKIVNFGKRLAVIKSAESRKYVEDFVKAHRTAQPFTGEVCLSVQAMYQDRRRDLDVALLQDALQAAGVIKNDRQIIEIHAERFVDKDNPRTWILLTEVNRDARTQTSHASHQPKPAAPGRPDRKPEA